MVRFRPNSRRVGQLQANVDRFRTILVEVGGKLAEIGPDLSRSGLEHGRICPKLGRHRTKFGDHIHDDFIQDTAAKLATVASAARMAETSARAAPLPRPCDGAGALYVTSSSKAASFSVLSSMHVLWAGDGRQARLRVGEAWTKHTFGKYVPHAQKVPHRVLRRVLCTVLRRANGRFLSATSDACVRRRRRPRPSPTAIRATPC